MDDDEVKPSDHVIPLPMPHGWPQPGTATIAHAMNSRVTSGNAVQCTATSKGTGLQCRRLAVRGAVVCVVHGAAEGTPARAKAGERLVAEYEEWIEEAARGAMANITRILEDPEDDKVALAASRDVLDRSGFGAVRKSMNVNIDADGGLDIDAQIDNALEERARKAARREKDEGVMDV